MTKWLDRNYDGIIIGAGHHGLILGTYLARAGLKILLVDRRLRYGGGLSTECQRARCVIVVIFGSSRCRGREACRSARTLRLFD
jgi:ribulose 1,5-bisphosphate synthetase/thiazole synthase